LAGSNRATEPCEGRSFHPARVRTVRDPREARAQFDRGQPLTRQAVSYLVGLAAQRAGLPGVHPRTLRHSYGYYLANKGHDLRLIQDYLESFAEGRARREMTKLLSRVPRTALRHRNGLFEEVGLEVLEPGDRILVRRGEVVAVDGAVSKGAAVLDQSALTGESLPVQQHAGEAVLSGSTNAEDTFDLVVSARAEASTYAGIVRLVEAAQQSKTPMSRLADRFAMAFLGVTVAIAGGAWIWTGDPIRALAVLVVATPCPLILAVPVAIISGVSRAAKLGILIKGGRALENLASVRTPVIDKTGTLTYGAARLVSVEAATGFQSDELLGLAASLDQASSHVIAQALVSAAREKGCTLTTPDTVSETAGEGVEGLVGGWKVEVGEPGFVARRGSGASPGFGDGRPHVPPGAVLVAVAVDGRIAGRLVLFDELRAGTKELLNGLRVAGNQRIVLASGDRAAVADAVVAGLPIDEVRADLTPDQKIAVIRDEHRKAPVLMVGDGVNDAPALAAADVGIAMAARGAAASSEVADVVLLVDRLDRVLSALRIAGRSRRIALQSVYAGVGLSFFGMVAAALGYLTPVRSLWPPCLQLKKRISGDNWTPPSSSSGPLRPSRISASLGGRQRAGKRQQSTIQAHGPRQHPHAGRSSSPHRATRPVAP